MLGRGVDQILPHPGDPELREPYLRDARGYVRLAEHANGPISRPVDWQWPWGEVLALLDEAAPDVRLINLETTITADGEFAERKAVCYRMHPDNLPALTALRPDVCCPGQQPHSRFRLPGADRHRRSSHRGGDPGRRGGSRLAHRTPPGGGQRSRWTPGARRLGGDEIGRRSRILGSAPRPARGVADPGSVAAGRCRRGGGRGAGTQTRRRCRHRLGALGIQLGLCDSAKRNRVRAPADRCRHRHHSRTLLAPSQADRDIPRQTDPVRLR